MEAIETNETTATYGNTENALLKMPREARARVQGMRFREQMNGLLVVRETRRYWLVSGSSMNLGKAVETIGASE